MKCLLVMPPWSPSDVYTGEFSDKVSGVWPPIGHLCSLAAMIKQKDHHVEILDGAYLNSEDIVKKVKITNAKFIGLYLNAFLMKSALHLIDILKVEAPETIIAIGGPLVSACKEKCFEWSHNIDVAFLGEADITIQQFVEAIEHDTEVKNIRGIILKENGKLINTGFPDTILDLDSLPFPARELIDNNRYVPPLETYRRLPVTYIMSSRGCTNRCLYCFQINPDHQGIRYRSAENVLAEIDECVLKYKFKEIRFFDDNFAQDLDRVDKLCQGLIKRNYDLTWYCSSRVDNINLEIMKTMKKSGCWGILFGAESGVQKNLNTLRKNATIQQTAKSVKEARKAGLKVVTPFIFGIPGETFEEGIETIKFACKINPFTANFHTLTPFPGTELYDNIDKYGTRKGDFMDYTFEKAVFIPKSMSQKEIIKLREIAFKKFFSRPKYIIRRILNIRTITDIRILWNGFNAFIKMYTNKESFNI